MTNKGIVAENLEEYRVSINSDREKDIWLYWLLLKREGRAIVFVNSITGALRLGLEIEERLFSENVFARNY